MIWTIPAAGRLRRSRCLLFTLMVLPGAAAVAQQSAPSAAPQREPVAAQVESQEKSQADAQAAAAQVQDFHEHLLDAMQSEADFQTRLAKLQPVVLAFLDVPVIARICLGRTWRKLTEAQQNQFITALGDVISATYADRFSGFSGQAFELLAAEVAQGGIAVRSRLLRPNDAPVQLDYYFKRGRAFNVVADGVSDLSLRRADYNAIVKEQGFAALLEHLQRQHQNLNPD